MLIDSLHQPTLNLRRAIPPPRNGSVHAAALDHGALPARIKALVALCISDAEQCDGCIACHTKAAARGGATSEDVAETRGVSVLMDGGPAPVLAPIAWATLAEFSTRTASG